MVIESAMEPANIKERLRSLVVVVIFMPIPPFLDCFRYVICFDLQTSDSPFSCDLVNHNLLYQTKQAKSTYHLLLSSKIPT